MVNYSGRDGRGEGMEKPNHLLTRITETSLYTHRARRPTRERSKILHDAIGTIEGMSEERVLAFMTPSDTRDIVDEEGVASVEDKVVYHAAGIGDHLVRQVTREAPLTADLHRVTRGD